MRNLTIQTDLTRKRLYLLSHYKLWPQLLLIIYTLSFSACAQIPESEEKLEIDTQKSFYNLGFDFGTRLDALKNKGKQIDSEALVRGVVKALSDAKSNISKEEIQAIVESLKKALSDDSTSIKPVEEPARGNQYVDDYAKLNVERPNVVVTTSGVQYEVLKAGSGKQATLADTVLVHYQGSLSNGTVFDSTYEGNKPAPLKINEVAVPGLKEALLLMHEGDKWRVVVPPSMGFVNFGNNRLRRRDLIYEIELVAVESPSKSHQ